MLNYNSSHHNTFKMQIQCDYTIISLLIIAFGIITEVECRNKPITSSKSKNTTNTKENSLKILSLTKELQPDMPLDFVSVFNDASDVFRKVVGMILSKKRLIGLDSGWYW